MISLGGSMSRIFSRGGGGGGGAVFQKIFKTLLTFFLCRKNWFSELSQSTKKSLFKNSPQAIFFLKNDQKMLFLDAFWKIFTKKIAFFWRALPP